MHTSSMISEWLSFKRLVGCAATNVLSDIIFNGILTIKNKQKTGYPRDYPAFRLDELFQNQTFDVEYIYGFV